MDIISVIVSLGIFAVIIWVLLALLPGVIAFSRGHRYKWVILLVGFFGSSFFIPWIAMVIWASWPRKSTFVDPLIGSPIGLDSRNVGTVAGEIRNQYASTKSDPTPSSGDTNSFRRAFDGERTLSNDAYKLFLLKKYKIKKNDVLEAYVVSSKIFNTLDEAFSYLAELEQRGTVAPEVRHV
jgi:hypothetical protein